MSGALADIGHVSKYARDIDWINALPDMGPACLRVAMVMKAQWDNALAHGEAFIAPGVAQLAELARVSLATVARTKKALADAGLLIVEAQRHKDKSGLWWRQRDRIQVIVGAAVRALSEKTKTGVAERHDDAPDPPPAPPRYYKHRLAQRLGVDDTGLTLFGRLVAAGLGRSPLQRNAALGRNQKGLLEARPSQAPALDLVQRGEGLDVKLNRMRKLREEREARDRGEK